MRMVFQPGWFARRLALLLSMLVVGPQVCAATVVDRIVATVNHRLILQSEWDDAVRFEALVNRRRLQDVTAEQRRQALDRLIDQALIEQQMGAVSYPAASHDEVALHIQELRETVPEWSTDGGWGAALAAYGLTEQDVEDRITTQADIVHYLDSRFRPDVRIDRGAVEAYYRKQFLPELRRRGAGEVPLRDVAPKIERLLIEKQLGELQDEWLQSLRAEASVQIR